MDLGGEWYLRFIFLFGLLCVSYRYDETDGSRHLRELCQQFNMKLVKESGGGELRCEHWQNQAVYIVKEMVVGEVLVLPSNITGSAAKMCRNGRANSIQSFGKESSNKNGKIMKEKNAWICEEVKLVVPASETKDFIQWATNNKNSVLIKLGQYASSRLNYRKRFRRDSRIDEPRPDNHTSGKNAPAPNFEDLWFRPANEEYESYPPAPINQNDMGDWRWLAGGGEQRKEIKLPSSLASNMTQAVYNINGVTWLCRQFRQLECYPVFDNIDKGGGIPLIEPITRRTRPLTTTTQKPKSTKPPKTTFCSRVIKFKAKDSAILKFSTFDGIVRVLIRAQRQNGEVMVMAKILKETDTGLDIRENVPEIILDVTVDCDNININVDGVKYVKGYMFGRDGVRDLEIVGNLESTGMAPRLVEPPPKGRSRNDKNLLQRDGYVEVRVPKVNGGEIDAAGHDDGGDSKEHAIGGGANDQDGDAKDAGEEDQDVDAEEEIDGIEESDGNVENNVVDKVQGGKGLSLDPLQVEGTGDVEVSLNDGRKNHRYQISRGPDDEVNVDIVFGPNGFDNKSLIIENKDYNYTLVVTGQNFQIIHHDTKRNVTYEHGLRPDDIAGLNVEGQVRNTQVTFKEEQDEVENEPIPSGLVLTQDQTVSIYGSLCTEPCKQAADGSHWCAVKAGSSEKCGPKPGSTPGGEECSSECRKLEDPYYWCNRKDQPWEYCSPKLNSQQIACENDSPRVMTMEPTDCSRYIICEAGNLKLEECPVGLHFTEANQTCEWPSNKNPCNTISSKPSQASRNDPRSLFGAGKVNEVTAEPARITTPATTSSAGGEKINGAAKSQILSEASDVGIHGLTSHGELCLDACERRGYKYFWCKKTGSSLGQWWDSDFCSPHPGVTHYGEDCSEDSQCDQYGENYFWCNKKGGAWGYCSPQKIYREGSCSIDGWYALVGDCEHYVICRGGNPVVFSCLKGLYFDYLVLSCTSKDNAQCVYQ